MTEPEPPKRGEWRAVLDTNVPSATHIVTYDPHFDVLGGAYHDIPILDGLHFLYVVRGDRPPNE